MQNEDVQFHWVLLSQDIDDPQNGEALLVEIVKLWVTIRGFSLAASWMEEYKRNMRKTTEKSTGLRKSISGKKKNFMFLIQFDMNILYFLVAFPFW